MLGHKAFGADRNNLGASPRRWHHLYGTGSGAEALKGKVLGIQAQRVAVLPRPELPRSAPGEVVETRQKARPEAACSDADPALPQSTKVNSPTKERKKKNTTQERNYYGYNMESSTFIPDLS